MLRSNANVGLYKSRWFALQLINDTHRENLIQYENLIKKVLAASDLSDLFTQLDKIYNAIKSADI